MAYVLVRGRMHGLGTYAHERDAAIAQDRAALFFFGPAAKRNFPKVEVAAASPIELRAELRASVAEHTRLEAQLDATFNPHWGPLFREGREISKFGEQVEAYACVYTSRASNFRFYSPNRHFRGPRDRMPHER